YETSCNQDQNLPSFEDKETKSESEIDAPESSIIVEQEPAILGPDGKPAQSSEEQELSIPITTADIQEQMKQLDQLESDRESQKISDKEFLKEQLKIHKEIFDKWATKNDFPLTDDIINKVQFDKIIKFLYF